MSLVQLVVDLIEDYGPATVDDLMPRIDGKTRDQVIGAMKNARQRGLIRVKSLGKRAGRTPSGGGSEPALFEFIEAEPPPPPEHPPVASVWELGARALRETGAAPLAV